MATKTSFSPTIPISPENIKIAQYFVIGLVLWLIVSGRLRKNRQASQYQQAGSDANTSYAIQVRQACNPSGLKYLIDFDGTWENDLMLVADQIGDVDTVNKAYVNLYNENMYERLEKELNSTKFQAWLKRAKATPTAATASATASATIGTKLVALRDAVILSDTDSSKVARKVKAGANIGDLVKAYNITNKLGVKSLYYLVSWTSFGFLYNQGLVLAADTKKA